jgi:hypothetical protein
MHFIAHDEARSLEKQLLRQIAGKSKPKLILYYDSGRGDYLAAARAITAAIGEFSEATLHFQFCVGGDGSEGNELNEHWRRYRQWRGATGEHRRLYDAPVHRFERDDAEHLCTVLEFALQLGWDALLAAKPGRQLLLLSHDDRIEIYRGFDWRSLAERLIALGYWHR